MSLNDLIRSVHAKKDPSSDIDLFLHSRSDDVRKLGWHPSDFAGMCTRQRVLMDLLKIPLYAEISPRLKRIFDIGKAVHRIYQEDYFGKMGHLWGKWKCLRCNRVEWGFEPMYDVSKCYPENTLEMIDPNSSARHIWEYKEVPMKATIDGLSKPLLGHSDGMLNVYGEWHVLELKSINHFGFQKLVEPVYKHWCQGQVYGELIRQRLIVGYVGSIPIPKKLVVGYINKNNSEEKFFISPLDGAEGRRLLMQPIIYEDSFSNQKLPDEKDKDCNGLLDPKVKKCPVGTYCFGSLSWNQLFAQGVKNG